MTDTLANVERLEPVPAEQEPVPGYWRGGAVAEVQQWQARALAAEHELRAIRADVAAEVRRRRGVQT